MILIWFLELEEHEKLFHSQDAKFKINNSFKVAHNYFIKLQISIKVLSADFVSPKLFYLNR